MQLEILEELLERDATRAREYVSEIRATTRHAMASLRSSLLDITPDVPDGTWLCEGLKRLVDSFADDWGLELSFACDGDAKTIETEAVGLVFTFVTESLTNVRKYSPSCRGDVRASFDDETMLVSVSDEGPAPSRGVSELPGHGLNILWGRAHLLGGDLRIEQPSGKGIEVVLELPI